MKIGIKAMFEYTLGGKVKQVAGGGLVLEKPKFGEDAPQSLTGGFQVMLANMLGIGRGCDASDDVSSPQPSLTQPETDNT
jgi:hypothetical protein